MSGRPGLDAKSFELCHRCLGQDLNEHQSGCSQISSKIDIDEIFAKLKYFKIEIINNILSGFALFPNLYEWVLIDRHYQSNPRIPSKDGRLMILPLSTHFVSLNRVK